MVERKWPKRINYNDLLPWFTQDHGQLPKAYLKSCDKFFRELGIKAASNEAASHKLQASWTKANLKCKQRFNSQATSLKLQA